MMVRTRCISCGSSAADLWTVVAVTDDEVHMERSMSVAEAIALYGREALPSLNGVTEYTCRWEAERRPDGRLSDDQGHVIEVEMARRQ